MPLRYTSKSILSLALAPAILLGCAKAPTKNTFAEDVDVMNKHNQTIVLELGQAKVAVLAEYQGRIMTSTAKGDDAESYGWIHHKRLSEDGPRQINKDPGGEDRLWFGPETGPYSIIFKPGVEPIVENITIPEAMSTITFDVIEQNKTSVHFHKNVSIQNHYGFTFNFDVNRSIHLFDNKTIEKNLAIDIGENLYAVGFSSQSKITNTGKQDWKKESGLLSLWDISAFKHGKRNTVVMPTRNNIQEVVAYFNETRESHTRIIDNIVYYNADADYMNKIGIPPQHTVPLMAAYNADTQRLTIATFQFDDTPNATYVNSVWLGKPDPYKGDVINIFNDGRTDGVKPFGPFYELESSSNAKELKIGESQSHAHNTYHFEGDIEQMNAIVKTLFNLSLDQINSVFPK